MEWNEFHHAWIVSEFYRLLLERKGEVVSARELFQSVWGDEVYYARSNSTITVHIRHLREKLRDSVEHPRFIKTIWGVGYKIETHPSKG